MQQSPFRVAAVTAMSLLAPAATAGGLPKDKCEVFRGVAVEQVERHFDRVSKEFGGKILRWSIEEEKGGFECRGGATFFPITDGDRDVAASMTSELIERDIDLLAAEVKFERRKSATASAATLHAK